MLSSQELRNILQADDLAALEHHIQGPPGLTIEELDEALAEAVESSSPDVIDTLFRHGAHVSRTMDQRALRRKDLLIYDILLKNGWNINSTMGGPTALYLAVGNPERLRWFLERGANPDTLPDRRGTAAETLSPLEEAAHMPTATSLEILLEYGAEIDPRVLYQTICYHPRGSRVNPISYVPHMKALLDHGYDINIHYPYKGTPLHAALRYGKTDMMKYLVKRGADINYWSFQIGTPLHSAVEGDRKSMIRYMLSVGADASLRDTWGRTPADLAKAKGYIDLYVLLEGKNKDYDGIVEGEEEEGSRAPSTGIWRSRGGRRYGYRRGFFHEFFDDFLQDIRYLWAE